MTGIVVTIWNKIIVIKYKGIFAHICITGGELKGVPAIIPMINMTIKHKDEAQ